MDSPAATSTASSVSRSTTSSSCCSSTRCAGSSSGFPPELVYGRVLPGAAVSILVGNVFYALQARSLAERTGRTDVCALPYGINTVSLIAHVFLVMLPAKALADGSRRGRSGAHRVAGGPRRDALLPASSSWRRAFVAERVAQGDAARGAALDARRHRARLHLARLSLPHLRPPDRRPDDARRRDADVLRPRALQGTPARRRSWRSRSARCCRGSIGHRAGRRRTRARRRFTCRFPSSAISSPRSRGGHLLPYLSVIVAMGLFNVLGLAAEHRVGRSGRRRVRDAVRR